jgi:hypothetical protein
MAFAAKRDRLPDEVRLHLAIAELDLPAFLTRK